MPPRVRYRLSLSRFRIKRGRLILQPWLISILLGIPAFLVVSPGFEPYRITLEQKELSSYDQDSCGRYFDELAGKNQHSEFTLFSNRNEPGSMVIIYQPNGIVLDQWNFKGQFTHGLFRKCTGDYNHDNLREVYCVTREGNSLLMNVVEPFGSTRHLVKNRLIDTIWTTHSQGVVVLVDGQCYDLNGDGYDEFVFILSTGAGRQPRKIYAYDLVEDSLWSSPFGGNILANLLIGDFDRDGEPEVTGGMHTSNNYSGEIVPLHDSLTWFVVYDKNLHFKRLPVEIGGIGTRTFPVLNRVDGKDYYFLYDVFPRTEDIRLRRFELNDLDPLKVPPTFGEVPFQGLIHYTFSTDRESFLVYEASGRIDFYNPKGELLKSRSIRGAINHLEISSPGAGPDHFNYALLQAGSTPSLHFFSHHGKAMASAELEDVKGSILITWAAPGKDYKRLLVIHGNLHAFYKVKSNPVQLIQILILLGLISAFFAFISLIRYIQARQIAQTEKYRKEILELQLQGVRNQLDPHFTFNALNALSSLIYTGDSKGIEHFISHFSRMLRSLLNSSDRVLIPLKEEIDFVTSYLELQRIRFEEAFTMQVLVQDGIDLYRQVPKMLIQGHLENAIKHGLLPKVSQPGRGEANGDSGRRAQPCMVRIELYEMGDRLEIVIEDNGVGRGKRGVSHPDSTGTGLRNLNRIISSVRQLYGMEIRQTIEDLADSEGRSAGTRVKITVRV
ncbi:MAG: histidine kinase [Bacteroidales bacterium]